jgi:hypothetical protein
MRLLMEKARGQFFQAIYPKTRKRLLRETL